MNEDINEYEKKNIEKYLKKIQKALKNFSDIDKKNVCKSEYINLISNELREISNIIDE